MIQPPKDSNQGCGYWEFVQEPVRLPAVPTQTKFCTNHNWNRRNAGRKPKEKK